VQRYFDDIVIVGCGSASVRSCHGAVSAVSARMVIEYQGDAENAKVNFWKCCPFVNNRG
jgi:hypothetical protein